MIVAAFDLATASAVCYGRPDVTPTVEAVRAPVTGTDLGLFAKFYWLWFNRILDRLYDLLEPEETILVAFEAPILMGAGKRKDGTVGPMTTLATTRKLQSLGVLLELACELHAARTVVRECNVASLKKEITGSGHADKSLMVLAARRAGIELPPGKEAMDGADCFAAFVLAVRHWAPEHRAAWDRRLLAPRGQERLTAAQARDLFRK